MLDKKTASLRDCLKWLSENSYYILDSDGYYKPNLNGIKAIYHSDILDFVYCIERLSGSAYADSFDELQNYEGVEGKFSDEMVSWFKLNY